MPHDYIIKIGLIWTPQTSKLLLWIHRKIVFCFLYIDRHTINANACTMILFLSHQLIVLSKWNDKNYVLYMLIVTVVDRKPFEEKHGHAYLINWLWKKERERHTDKITFILVCEESSKRKTESLLPSQYEWCLIRYSTFAGAHARSEVPETLINNANVIRILLNNLRVGVCFYYKLRRTQPSFICF